MLYTPWSEPTAKRSMWFGLRATTVIVEPGAATPPATLNQFAHPVEMSHQAL
jgi:hypothetical protein